MEELPPIASLLVCFQGTSRKAPNTTRLVALLPEEPFGSRLGGSVSAKARSRLPCGLEGRRDPDTRRMLGARQFKTFCSKEARLNPALPPK